MKKSLLMLPLPLFFAATACQQADHRGSTDTTEELRMESPAAADAAAEAAASKSAPDIDTSVAPGVAFDFRYQFALAADRISGVQEDHAQACKRLGIGKCRVTGMDYQSSGDTVTAMLAFKLAPDVATDFTRDAKAIVDKAEGELTNANLSGNDIGSNIAAGESEADQIRGELAQIDAQLKTMTLGKEVRARLVDQMAELRARLRELASSARTDKTALAMTPVVFDYSTRATLAGFDTDSAFGDAFATSVNGFVAMLKIILVLLGAIAPWALLAGAVALVVRRLRRKVVTPVVEG